MKNVMDPTKSILILNLVCRNEELRLDYLREIQKHFKFMCFYDVPDEVNRLVFCFSDKVDLDNVKNNLSSLVLKSIESILLKNISSARESNQKFGKTNHASENMKVDKFDGALDDADIISDSFKILTD